MGLDLKQKYNLKNLNNIQQDIKDHQDILAEIKSQEEIAQKKLSEASDALNQVALEKEELEKEVQSLSGEIQVLIKMASKVLVEILENIKNANSVSDKHLKFIQELGVRISQEKTGLAKIKDLQKQVQSEILEENRKLSIRKSDLDVYQRRIEEEYKKLLPNEKVFL